MGQVSGELDFWQIYFVFYQLLELWLPQNGLNVVSKASLRTGISSQYRCKWHTFALVVQYTQSRVYGNYRILLHQLNALGVLSLVILLEFHMPHWQRLKYVLHDNLGTIFATNLRFFSHGSKMVKSQLPPCLPMGLLRLYDDRRNITK